jgi:hypothetical protein
MDSLESKRSLTDRKPLAADLNLPVFEQPQVEHWPAKMSWAQAMRHLAPNREHYMRNFDSPEKRWHDKNPTPFVLP